MSIINYQLCTFFYIIITLKPFISADYVLFIFLTRNASGMLLYFYKIYNFFLVFYTEFYFLIVVYRHIIGDVSFQSPNILKFIYQLAILH